MVANQRPLSENPSENLFVRKPVVKRVDGRSGAWPANGRMTATGRWKARHEETRNPFAAIAHGAIRPADRCRGDRPSLHILARGLSRDRGDQAAFANCGHGGEIGLNTRPSPAADMPVYTAPRTCRSRSAPRTGHPT